MKRNLHTYLTPEAELEECLLAGEMFCVSGEGEIDDVGGDDWGELTSSPSSSSSSWLL